MSKQANPTIDESIAREEVNIDDLKAAMQMMLQPESDRLKSENREPTNVEMAQYYRMVRNE